MRRLRLRVQKVPILPRHEPWFARAHIVAVAHEQPRRREDQSATWCYVDQVMMEPA